MLSYGTTAAMGDMGSLIESQLLQKRQVEQQDDNERRDLVWLCLEPIPDATALIDSNGTGVDPYLLLYFKVDQFWTVKIDDMKQFILNHTSPLGITANSAKVHGIWPKFPISPSNAISLNGLDVDDVFYRNVFLFKADDMYRYKIKQIEDDRIKEVTLLGIHKTTYWMESVSESLILAPRHGHMIGVIGLASTYPFQVTQGMLLQMTETNMENPVLFDVKELPLNVGGTSRVRFFHDIGLPELLNIRTTEEFCIGDTCRAFLSRGICSFINSFKDSFGFWLWYNTTFTFRLLMTSFLGVMLINFTIASAFIWNQIKLMADMT